MAALSGKRLSHDTFGYPRLRMRILAIPVKSLSHSKRRLAGVFSPLERGALTLAMLEDVLDAALAQTGWDTVVVSPDEAVLEIAVRRGVRPLIEEKGPLAGALRQVEAETAEMTADALAILPGDVAMVTAESLADALHTLGPVVMAEADGDGGTNLLLRRPPKAIPSRFGNGSFAKHLESAASRDLPVARVTRPELSFDLDTARDAAQLLVSGVPGRTRECLLALGGDERLRAEGA